jgi:integrase
MARNTTGIRRVQSREHPQGWCHEVYGRAGGLQFSKRFAPDTTLVVMRHWREERLRQLRKAKASAPTAGLAKDVEGLLRREAGRRQVDFRILLGHWVKAFGSRSRYTLTPAEIQEQLETWRAEGVAASTVNHRRQALLSMFRRLDPDYPNPVAKTTKFDEPEPEPRAPQDDVIERVFAVAEDCATKYRLMMIFHTGMRHSELMRVVPETDVVLGDQAHVKVRTGKGGKARIVPLIPAAVEVVRKMHQWGGWGIFSQSSARKSWLVWCKRAGVSQHVRPYDLRHRFGTRLRERGVDLDVIRDLMGHRSGKTTLRYAPVVRPNLQDAMNRLAGESAGESPASSS